MLNPFISHLGLYLSEDIRSLPLITYYLIDPPGSGSAHDQITLRLSESVRSPSEEQGFGLSSDSTISLPSLG